MTKNALALFIFVACAASMARAQRQVIDAHAHVTLSEAAVRRAVQIMDENGIVKMVDLSGGFGEQLKSKIELYNKIAPGRFAVFTNMDFSKVNDPQFSKKAMADLEEAYRLGARGLKSFKSLGLVHKDQTGRLIRFDDPRFDPVWTKCGWAIRRRFSGLPPRTTSVMRSCRCTRNGAFMAASFPRAKSCLPKW